MFFFASVRLCKKYWACEIEATLIGYILHFLDCLRTFSLHKSQVETSLSNEQKARCKCLILLRNFQQRIQAFSPFLDNNEKATLNKLKRKKGKTKKIIFFWVAKILSSKRVSFVLTFMSSLWDFHAIMKEMDESKLDSKNHSNNFLLTHSVVSCAYAA